MWVQITACTAVQKEAADLRTPVRFPALCGRSLPQNGSGRRGGRVAVHPVFPGLVHLSTSAACGVAAVTWDPAHVWNGDTDRETKATRTVSSDDQAVLCSWLFEASSGRGAFVPSALLRAGAEQMASAHGVRWSRGLN